MSKSPYLTNDRRLADVIAAIQAMATYRFYKLDFAGWADRITGDGDSKDHWRCVFEDHPEFFRLDSKKEKASLVIRRQHRKRYDVDEQMVLSNDEYEGHSDWSRVSRTPLSPDELSSLVETAIEMHSRAIAQKQLGLWWIPIVTALAGFVGAILGALINVSGT